METPETDEKIERIGVIGIHLFYTYLAGVGFFILYGLINNHGFSAYNLFSALGESLGILLFPSVLVAVPCIIYKFILKKEPKSGVIIFWIVWGISIGLSLYGQYLASHATSP